MRFVWATALKDLRKLRHDPLALTTWLAIPLVLAVMMHVLFGRNAPLPQGRLLLADEDNTFLSGLVTGAFSREPLSKMVLVEKVTLEEGRARIDRGDASGFLRIPKGLQDAYLRNEPFRLQLVTNPSQRVLPKIIEQALSVMLDAGFYIQQVAAVELRTFDSPSEPSEQTIAQTSIAINRIAKDVRLYLDPPVIQLETSVITEKKETQSFASVFFPSMIFLSLLFVTNGLATEIWKEQASGTLRRVAASPVSMGAFLAGRLIVVSLVLCGVAVVGLAGLRGLATSPVSNLPGAALWIVLTGAAIFLPLLVISLYTSSRRAADIVGNLIILPMSMIGGCFMPFETMPAWMVRIGRLTPNGWAVIQFKAILAGTANGPALAVAAAGLALLSALAFVLAARRLRRGFLM
jgi:ABC-type multidrug transport system permease subunit